MGYKGSNLKPADITEILRLRNTEPKTPREEVAALFDISPRTVTRICTGKVWKDIVSTSPHQKKPTNRLKALPRGYDKDHNEIIDLKRVYGFDFYRPLFWGTYDSWDGTHAVASDGVIMWISRHLSEKAQTVSRTQRNGHPFFGDLSHELSTFEVAKIMDSPIGGALTFKLDKFDGTIEFRTVEGDAVTVAEKFFTIAQRMGLDFFSVENDPNRVFMVKYDDSLLDPSDGIQAAVAVMR